MGTAKPYQIHVGTLYACRTGVGGSQDGRRGALLAVTLAARAKALKG